MPVGNYTIVPSAEFSIVSESDEGHPIAIRAASHGSYASVQWPISEKKQKGFFLESLSNFYEIIKTGNYRSGFHSISFLDPLAHGLYQFGPPNTFDITDGLHIERLQDCRYFLVSTPLAEFGITQNLDYSAFGRHWSPAIGEMFVSTNQDMTGPVEGLISKTAKYRVEERYVKKFLGEIFQSLVETSA